MSPEEMKAVVRRVLEEGVNGRRLDVLDAAYVPDYRHHDPSLPPDVQEGLDAYKRHFATFYEGFPDLRVDVQDMLADGDRVATRWRFHGTHAGPLMGIPPTGRTVAVDAQMLHRFAGGRIAEGWVTFDALGMLQQLGVVPAPTG